MGWMRAPSPPAGVLGVDPCGKPQISLDAARRFYAACLQQGTCKDTHTPLLLAVQRRLPPGAIERAARAKG